MGDCDRFKSNYSNYIEKRMDPTTAGEIEQHLNSCDRCRKIFRQMVFLQKIMTDLPIQKCSENFNIKLHQKISDKYNPLATREEAEKIEQYLTKRLRAKGHGVWSN